MTGSAFQVLDVVLYGFLCGSKLGRESEEGGGSGFHRGFGHRRISSSMIKLELFLLSLENKGGQHGSNLSQLSKPI